MIPKVKHAAAIVITTYRRCDDLIRCINSCLAQDMVCEILVFDDASDDDTAERIRKAFPTVRLFASSERKGLIVNRNRGFTEASAPIVISIDDDAYFSRPDIVSGAVRILGHDPQIGAVAMPYIEPLPRRSHSSQTDPFQGKPGQDLRAYVGCAHAVRRQVALQLGGYREFFVHQHEERDLCLRMRAAGWRIVYGDTAPIVHMANPDREQNRVIYYGGRNQILFETLNAPFPEVVWRVWLASLGIIRYRFAWRTLPVKMRAIGAGLVESARYWNLRRPVTRKLYSEYRTLKSHGSETWDGPMPPPCHERTFKQSPAVPPTR